MAEIKVSTRGLKMKFDDVQKRIKEVLSDYDVMSGVASVIEKDIRRQTRNGLDPDGAPLKELTTTWIEKRRTIEDSKHGAYKFDRSNLTVTGQLLDALRIVPEQGPLSNARRFLYFFVGQHSGYSFENAKDSKSISNDKLGKYVQDQGRNFVGVRESLVPRIKRMLVAAIRRAPEAFK
jgi:hypothetical protein